MVVVVVVVVVVVGWCVRCSLATCCEIGKNISEWTETTHHGTYTGRVIEFVTIVQKSRAIETLSMNTAPTHTHKLNFIPAHLSDKKHQPSPGYIVRTKRGDCSFCGGSRSRWGVPSRHQGCRSWFETRAPAWATLQSDQDDYDEKLAAIHSSRHHVMNRKCCLGCVESFPSLCAHHTFKHIEHNPLSLWKSHTLKMTQDRGLWSQRICLGLEAASCVDIFPAKTQGTAKCIKSFAHVFLVDANSAHDDGLVSLPVASVWTYCRQTVCLFPPQPIYHFIWIGVQTGEIKYWNDFSGSNPLQS